MNGVNLYLKLFKNITYLMSVEVKPEYKIELFYVVFKTCMVKIDEGFLLNHANSFENRTTKYPPTQTEITMNSISAGSELSSGRTFIPTISI